MIQSTPGKMALENAKLPIKIVKPGEVKTTMKDIGGYQEAKLEVIEFVNFVKNKERYESLGARLPKGALLYGPPGNGKTLLARATAGEGNITFITCSGSQLLISPDGPAQLREIFQVARQHSPCVLFFDEMDSIGKARDHYRSNPQTQALTQELLVQLDGFEEHKDSLVIVLGATNGLQDVDWALQRAGRFDRSIPVNEPDLQARLAIYNVHLAPLKTNIIKDGVAMTKEAIAKQFAMLTPGFSGAQIAAVCNEAAMIAAREKNEDVKMEHFRAAVDRVSSGLRKKQPLSPEEKKVAAYHNAGHAVAGWLLEGVSSPMTKISVTPDASGKGVCCQPKINLENLNKRKSMNIIAVMLAGRESQKLFLGEYTTNSAKDLEQATILATNLSSSWTQQGARLADVSQTPYGLACSKVSDHSMTSEFNPMWFYSSNLTQMYTQNKVVQFNLSDSLKDGVFKKVQQILGKANKIAEKLLLKHQDVIKKIADELIAKDMVEFEKLEEILGPNPYLDMATLRLADENFLPVGLENWKRQMQIRQFY